ncbi:MAG: MiaB/RimO family radical SAM methylthiotransferase, partial [Tepidiformaceae bacterium]
MRPVAVVLTLGCKLNLADSEEIGRGLRAAGYEVVDRLCEAQAYVLNTCSVTHVADAKSRGLIRSVRRLAPEALLTVTGCYPQSAGFEVAAQLGADLVVGMRDADKTALLDFLALHASGERPLEERGSQPLRPHTRAFIKAQEGCNDVCAFCIVPQTRGREQSRSIERVVLEVAAAVEAGAREVVITGTQLGAWGRDLDPSLKPHHLIAALLERTEVTRLRFSSLQPQDISPELLALWHDPRLMPHFHLALQSGSESTLSAMRRRYTARQFLQASERIHGAVPGVAITTDVIAGFPGESEADFDDTLRVCEAAGFARMHCFPYSQRSRTRAARMAAQTTHAERKERMGRLLELNERLSLAFRSRFEGTIRPVLWESPKQTADGPSAHGHTDNYIPVYLLSTDHQYTNGMDLRNRVMPVTLGAVYDDGVRGHFPGRLA